MKAKTPLSDRVDVTNTVLEEELHVSMTGSVRHSECCELFGSNFDRPSLMKRVSIMAKS